MPGVRSFTTQYKGLSRVLVGDVGLAVAYDPSVIQGAQRPLFKCFKGIWDTGATSSVITQKVVEELGLQPIGMTQVSHAHGKTVAEVYLVNISLPNGVAFAGITVTKGDLATNDVLIGMDIIGQGDFAVSNHNNRTTFSYRAPSVERSEQTATPETGFSGKSMFIGVLEDCLRK